MAFFFIFSSFLALVYVYTGIRLIPYLFTGKKAYFAWFCLVYSLLAVVFHIYLRVTQQYSTLSSFLAWTGYTSLGFISYLFLLSVFRDAIALISRIFLRVKHLYSTSQNNQLHNPDRRHFLYKATSFSIAAVSGAATLVGAAKALEPPTIVQINIPLPPGSKNLKGLTLAQFTDLHAGPTIGYDYIRPMADAIQALNADIIAFTGDLVDGQPQDLEHDLSVLKTLDAPLGKFFVTGNHEYYSGALQWIEYVKTLGFSPLLNEHRKIEYNNGHLTLAGVTDIQAHKFYPHHLSSPAKSIKGALSDSYKLLLAHQPVSIYKAAESGFDLQLSGHTHGGQYFPFQYAVPLDQPFVKGLYQYKNTRLYVSQGTGYWGPPLRLGTFPEITLFKFI